MKHVTYAVDRHCDAFRLLDIGDLDTDMPLGPVERYRGLMRDLHNTRGWRDATSVSLQPACLTHLNLSLRTDVGESGLNRIGLA